MAPHMIQAPIGVFHFDRYQSDLWLSVSQSPVHSDAGACVMADGVRRPGGAGRRDARVPFPGFGTCLSCNLLRLRFTIVAPVQPLLIITTFAARSLNPATGLRLPALQAGYINFSAFPAARLSPAHPVRKCLCPRDREMPDRVLYSMTFSPSMPLSCKALEPASD